MSQKIAEAVVSPHFQPEHDIKHKKEVMDCTVELGLLLEKRRAAGQFYDGGSFIRMEVFYDQLTSRYILQAFYDEVMPLIKAYFTDEKRGFSDLKYELYPNAVIITLHK